MKKIIILVVALVSTFYATSQVTTCWQCNGSGRMRCVMCNGGGVAYTMFGPAPCFACGGYGVTSCMGCNGSGVIAPPPSPTPPRYENVTSKCTNCDGEGFISTRHYSAEGGYTTKRRCAFCHGKGTVTKSELKY